MRDHVKMLGVMVLALMAMALGEVQCSDAPVPVAPEPPRFDGQRALRDAEQMVAIGPRPAGSEAGRRTQNYLIGQLEGAGLIVRQDSFTADTPAGEVPMKNVIGVLEGEQPGVIVIGAHFDTKRIPGAVFVGANDGAAGSAAVLELARVISARGKPAYTYWFVFFDGEEAVEEWSETDSTYGSRHLVDTLRKQEILDNVRAMILLDLIGDADLTVLKESTSYGKYRELFWIAARDLGYSDYFLPQYVTVEDDHTPFVNAGIRAVNLIDFMYGDRKVPGKYWHTPGDTLDKISAKSLQIVGEVVLEALPRIERLIHVVETRTGYVALPGVAEAPLAETIEASDAVGAALGVPPPEPEEPQEAEALDSDPEEAEEPAPPGGAEEAPETSAAEADTPEAGKPPEGAAPEAKAPPETEGAAPETPAAGDTPSPPAETGESPGPADNKAPAAGQETAP